ncbi:hypothetical protein UFOVP937_56 [uncultured Caudovirales phage]|uniref:Uncharacterized protein n=1 Tax=uncultured Caudovirales phage TaxID=2100421 RepID=A0A6J5SJM2_9CAUD|nr:hypothetical protein UFOVP937_56 [uncultured Caudovirales phage]CAB4214481.1 hypothetical protein UFOVP1465_45 [uncultured Caudovirales phage]
MPIKWDEPSETTQPAPRSRLKFDAPVSAAPSRPAEQMPMYDPMGGVTGYTEAKAPVSQQVRQFERREGPFGYAKEYGKGAIAGVAGLPGEVINLPGTLAGLAGFQVPRAPIGVSEASEFMFGKPKSEIAAGMRGAGEVFGIPTGPSALSAITKTAGAIARPFKYGTELVSTARGKGAREAAEAIRGEARGLAEEKQLGQQATIKSEQQRIAGLEDAERALMQKSQSDLQRIGSAQEQIANREALAAERAQRRAGTILDEKGRVIGGQTMEQLRAASLAKTRDRVRSEIEKAREAGLSEAEAASHLAHAEGRVVQAEQAVQKIEQELLGRERMTPEQLGPILSDATKKLVTDGIKAREEAAGFGKAISSAGEGLIVPTKSISDRIDQIIKGIRDPSIRPVLEAVKDEFKTLEGKKKVSALSIESADSLRKALDRIITTKKIQYANGTEGSAAAALHHLTEIRGRLVGAAETAHKPYKEALSEWRRMSRPLDIAQRKGPLKKVLDVDLFSQDLLRGSAEIAGAIIRRAKEGHPVFTRLLQINPEIRNGAKAYFNRELFAAEKVPTTDKLRNFLKDNEGVLRQLNLYDDFSTVARARAAGDDAMRVVKSELIQAKAGLKEATAAERAQQRTVSEAERVRGFAVKRQTETEKTAVTPKEIEAQTQLRAKEAEVRLAKQAAGVEKETRKAVEPIRARIGEAAVSSEKAASKVAEIEKSLERLSIADPRKAASEARDIVKSFSGELSTEQYGNLIRQIKMVEDAYGATDAARKKLLTIVAAGTGVGLLGGSAASAGRWLINRLPSAGD